MSVAEAVEIVKGREAARSGKGAQLRVAAGLSMSDVARAIDVSPSTVSAWEAGKVAAPRSKAARRYFELLEALQGAA